MDDSNGHHNNHLQTLTKADSFDATTTTTAARSATANNDNFHRVFCMDGFGQEDDEENNEGGDTEVWGTFTESFRQVQSVLDQNRLNDRSISEDDCCTAYRPLQLTD
ncbi:hypothetical protein F0562_026272 [Nyssa sinensis]|uniref:Protein EARLY FLOWERING 4 domain-containing protein n=1 Tax=Nyssa sinensis TaxID=561372 RepID=A0A5J5BAS5_9ASTE|nr:hypothetical protein F0562_026272 [Nyssa sinensis]